MSFERVKKIIIPIFCIATSNLLISCTTITTKVQNISSESRQTTSCQLSNNIILGKGIITKKNYHSKNVLLQIKNNFDSSLLLVEDAVRRKLVNSGYFLVQDPEHAEYILQLAVKYSGELSQKIVDDALTSGYGGDLVDLVGLDQGILKNTLLVDIQIIEKIYNSKKKLWQWKKHQTRAAIAIINNQGIATTNKPNQILARECARVICGLLPKYLGSNFK